MKRIFSGAQPTGNIHLGNYLGALRNWVTLQNEYESFFCIVNLHAVTLPQDPVVLRKKTGELARIYLAVGIDPEVSTIFVQSDVPEHGELTWMLNCTARLSELERMTQFKDKAQNIPDMLETFINIGQRDREAAAARGDVESENRFTFFLQQATNLRNFVVHEDRRKPGKKALMTVGFFDYPVLMAADILLYQTDLVPVGEDQKQHLEFARDLAIRFNRDYGSVFRVPHPYIPTAGARIMSLSDPKKKMSKSDNDPLGCLMLLDDADAVRRKFKRAVTDLGTEIRFDPSRPAINNLLTIYHLLTGKGTDEVEQHFSGKGYAKLKEELADVTIEFLKPIQERVSGIDDDKLNAILKKGATRAQKIARKTLSAAKAKMGLIGARK